MSNKYTFVELDSVELQDEIPPENNFVKALTECIPDSVQMLNIIQISSQKLYSPENTESIRFFSYELTEEIKARDCTKKPDEFILKPSSRNWSDQSRPFFIVCIIKTKYAMDGENRFNYRLMFSRDEPGNEMVPAFSNLFDWSAPNDLVFGTVNSRLIPFLEKVAKLNKRNATCYPNWTLYHPMDNSTGATFGDISQELKSKLKLNETIGPLRSDHAEVVNSHWKFGTDGSLPHIRDQIEHSVSAGLFPNSGNESDPELACWVITMPLGTLNTLHTREAYRRKGYAELVFKSASFELIQRGIYPLCEVELESAASKAMLDKLGFKLAFDAAWVYCKGVE